MKKLLLAATLCALAALLSPAAAGAADFLPGTPGTGDPYFPLAGNGGYQVGHYDVRFTYTPADTFLKGRVVVDATASQDLSSFDLDFRGMTVKEVLVDGTAASFARDGQELVVTPVAGIPGGAAFSVTVRYAGVPEAIVDPNGDIEGWIVTDDGAFVVGECVGTPTWCPVNDDPEDKATFEFAVKVPRGITVMANGVLRSHKTEDGWTTWRWSETDPMSPYLATTTLGRFDLTEYEIDGIPTYVAVDPQLSKGQVLRKLPAIVRFFSDLYGEYPFNAAGAIVDDAPGVGYALETQTKPNFDVMPSEWTLVHETAHMWYGDSVTLRDWPDIWLNEGFATWSNWIWSERQGKKSAHSTFKQYYSTGANSVWLWSVAPGAPGAEDLFDWGAVYLRGAMTLQALREKIGDAAFFGVMRTWAQENRHGSVTTPEFVTLAEARSGMDLDDFFRVWLYEPVKPASW
jgi:aminopeptidase N